MNKVLSFCCIYIFLIIFQIFGQGNSETSVEGVVIYGASSTSDVLEDLAEQYSVTHETDIVINAASSGVLARQLVQGAPGDIYVSASAQWMNYIVEENLTTSEPHFLMSNQLVLVTPKDSSLNNISFSSEIDLADFFQGRIALGDPDYVPAGRYGKEALVYYHWWESLESRLLAASNVRAALVMVERAETELAIVYRSDALSSSDTRILGTFPEVSHSPVLYYALLLNQENKAAADFFDFLCTSTEAGKSIESFGFKNLELEVED